jgi:uncharacterized damage-inducible protein DinB
MSEPEVWLRGPRAGFSAELMPVAHSLLQIREELDSIVPTLSSRDLWTRPGGAASIGFHLRHIAGSLDRLLTYARGESLTDAQYAALSAESDEGVGDAGALLEDVHAAIDRALAQLGATPSRILDEVRKVGRAALPSTVRGLLFHSAEHAQRHAGQIATTARIVKAGELKV